MDRNNCDYDNWILEGVCVPPFSQILNISNFSLAIPTRQNRHHRLSYTVLLQAPLRMVLHFQSRIFLSRIFIVPETPSISVAS